MVVVEVVQGTLGVDGQGGGPAGNTGRGWSWLRSGGGARAGEGGRGAGEDGAEIKSNNPHLTGGEVETQAIKVTLTREKKTYTKRQTT